MEWQQNVRRKNIKKSSGAKPDWVKEPRWPCTMWMETIIIKYGKNEKGVRKLTAECRE